MVTREMVDVAQQQLPGVWNRERVRRALVAAFALIPEPAAEIPLTHNLAVHLVVDEQQLRGAVLAAVEQVETVLPIGPDGKLDLAELRIAYSGALPTPGEQPMPDVREPHLNPALEHPLELGTLAAVARRLEVARSTVTGWVKQRATNGMPEPVDGDVYDLAAVGAWYRRWKGLDDAAED